jgi:hypothetical protein
MSDKKELTIVECSPDKPFETLFKEWCVANSQVMIEDGKTYLKYDALANLYARLIGPVPGTTVAVWDKYIYAQTTIGGAAVSTLCEIADTSLEVAVATVQTMALLRLFRQVLGPHLLDLGYESISAAEYIQSKKTSRRQDVKTSSPAPAAQSRPVYQAKSKTAYKPRPSGDRWAELDGCISSQQQKVLFARAKDNGTLKDVKDNMQECNFKDFNEIPADDFETFLTLAGERR